MIVRDRIVELYGARVLRRSALNFADGEETFKKLLAGRGYGTIVEIGTHRGCSTAAIAQHCKKVITFDLREGRLERLGQPFNRVELWRRLDIKNIVLILVKDDIEKAAIMSSLDFDFAFIDGAHDYESVRRDFRMVKRCGRVLFHDYDRRHRPGKDDVCDFIDTLPQHQIKKHNIFAMWSQC